MKNPRIIKKPSKILTVINPGTGRSGAVSNYLVKEHGEILRVPLNQTYGEAQLPEWIASTASAASACDMHAKLSMGLLDEVRKGGESRFADWIALLPNNFANILWYTEDQVGGFY